MQSNAQGQLNSIHNTAFQSAAIRAGHTLTGSAPKIFSDELALALSGMTAQEAIDFCSAMGPSNAATCVVRSRVTEDRLAAARARGVNQYVVLGAGLDTFALRMADRLGALQVYEIDDPVFQEWKRARIRELGFNAPEELHYAPCDFETMSIADALEPSRFRPDASAFISWLGVTQYLTRDAIEDTLRWAGSLPRGSEIVLTYVEDGPHTEKLFADAAARGVKLYSHLMPEEVTELLTRAGFTEIDHLTRDKANEIYFNNRSDGLIAPQYQRVASAIK